MPVAETGMDVVEALIDLGVDKEEATNAVLRDREIVSAGMLEEEDSDTIALRMIDHHKLRARPFGNEHQKTDGLDNILLTFLRHLFNEEPSHELRGYIDSFLHIWPKGGSPELGQQYAREQFQSWGNTTPKTERLDIEALMYLRKIFTADEIADLINIPTRILLAPNLPDIHLPSLSLRLGGLMGVLSREQYRDVGPYEGPNVFCIGGRKIDRNLELRGVKGHLKTLFPLLDTIPPDVAAELASGEDDIFDVLFEDEHVEEDIPF